MTGNPSFSVAGAATLLALHASILSSPQIVITAAAATDDLDVARERYLAAVDEYNGNGNGRNVDIHEDRRTNIRGGGGHLRSSWEEAADGHASSFYVAKDSTGTSRRRQRRRRTNEDPICYWHPVRIHQMLTFMPSSTVSPPFDPDTQCEHMI